jgi:hypothetical protein
MKYTCGHITWHVSHHNDANFKCGDLFNIAAMYGKERDAEQDATGLFHPILTNMLSYALSRYHGPRLHHFLPQAPRKVPQFRHSAPVFAHRRRRHLLRCLWPRRHLRCTACLPYQLRPQIPRRWRPCCGAGQRVSENLRGACAVEGCTDHQAVAYRDMGSGAGSRKESHQVSSRERGTILLCLFAIAFCSNGWLNCVGIPWKLASCRRPSFRQLRLRLCAYCYGHQVSFSTNRSSFVTGEAEIHRRRFRGYSQQGARDVGIY